MSTEKHRIDTLLIHAGEPEKRICGAVSLPVNDYYHVVHSIRLHT